MMEHTMASAAALAAGQPTGNQRAYIAAHGHVVGQSEANHERVHGVGSVSNGVVPVDWRLGREGVARLAGHDDVEAGRRGLLQLVHQRVVLVEGAGPAVEQNERDSIRVGREHADKVNFGRAVYLSGELGERVDLGLRCAPALSLPV